MRLAVSDHTNRRCARVIAGLPPQTDPLPRLLRPGRAPASVTACLRAPGDGPQRRQEVRTFGTTTRELRCLADWLTAAGCTHVAMESTGIYWRPVYNILEGTLVNAQHV